MNLSFHLCADVKGGKGADIVSVDDGGQEYYGAHTTFSDGNNMLLRTFAETMTGYKAENGISKYSPKLNTAIDRKFYRVTVSKPTAEDVVRFITVVYPSADASVDASFKSDWSDKSCSLSVSVNGTSYDLGYDL